ncbi:MAG: TonB-dependent receptor plug domain-containing protein [Acidobacteriia bacterium]|nr:TonB-dependent receptor plug domain-containing protein [Terriglobia bacterium]MYK10508.1 TonB-dependent receptor plug domain-containing protein [Terriglobia bacterium]
MKYHASRFRLSAHDRFRRNTPCGAADLFVGRDGAVRVGPGFLRHGGRTGRCVGSRHPGAVGGHVGAQPDQGRGPAPQARVPPVRRHAPDGDPGGRGPAQADKVSERHDAGGVPKPAAPRGRPVPLRVGRREEGRADKYRGAVGLLRGPLVSRRAGALGRYARAPRQPFGRWRRARVDDEAGQVKRLQDGDCGLGRHDMTRKTARARRSLAALWLAVASLAVTGTIAPQLCGQSDATLQGTITDPQGRVVPRAEVTVTHSGTGVSREVSTTGDGRYAIAALQPGSYSVTVSRRGFRLVEAVGILLTSGRIAEYDVRLELGMTQDAIEVEGNLSLVSTNAADWGGLVPERNLRDLPLNGRDLFELSALEPGATLPASARVGLAQGIGRQISVLGSRPNQNSFQLDGVYVNDAASAAPASATGNVLGLEMVQEVHLVTSPYSAEYGRTAGGVFTAVSRSGENRFHGSAYEYLRNNSLDARNFFDSPAAGAPPLRRNHFGAVLGGPVVRDRAFFLLNYESLRERRARTARPAVPTVEARLGHLPGEDIPVAAEVRPYLDLYPLPNGRDFGDGTAASIRQLKDRVDESYLSGKLDLVLDSATQLAARYTFDDASARTPDPMDLWVFGLDSRDNFLHTQLKRVHSPAMLSTWRAAFSRVDNFENSSTSVAPALAFVDGQPMGSITVNGLSNMGGFQARARPRRFILESYQFGTSLVRTTGKSTLRMGAGYDRVHFDQRSDLSAVGSYTFDSLALLLQARPRIAEVMQPGSDTVRNWRYNQYFGYFQHEFRVFDIFSVSMGVRYESVSTPTEVNGKIAVLRDFVNDPQTTLGGPLWRNPSKDNFAPRISVAFDPVGDARTVARGGFGIFYDQLGSRELTIAGVRTPPLFNRILVFGRPGFPDILQAAQGRNPSKSMDGVDYNLNQPYVARWQASMERQLSPSTVIRAGYSGARGIHLFGQLISVNSPIPEIQSDGRYFFPQGSPYVNPAFSRIGLRRTQFNSFYQGITFSLQSRLAKRLSMRGKYTWSRSIDEASNHTFNDFVASDQVPTVWNYRANRGRSDFDQEHVVAGNISLELWRGKGSPAAAVLGGWQLHGIMQVLSGTPFAPRVGFDRARLRPGFGDVGQRPDLVQGRTSSNIVLGDPSRYFDPTAFTLPEAGYLGTLGRGTLRGPGIFTMDIALHKALVSTERQSLKLRAEAFNVTNHPNFQVPSGRALFTRSGGRIGSAGRITSTSTSSRQVQLALRWEF